MWPHTILDSQSSFYLHMNRAYYFYLAIPERRSSLEGSLVINLSFIVCQVVRMTPKPFGSLASFAYQLPVPSPGINQLVSGLFSFCRMCDGSEPAAHWLKRPEYELQGSRGDGIILDDG